jgi:hypothetical protein
MRSDQDVGQGEMVLLEDFEVQQRRRNNNFCEIGVALKVELRVKVAKC